MSLPWRVILKRVPYLPCNNPPIDIFTAPAPPICNTTIQSVSGIRNLLFPPGAIVSKSSLLQPDAFNGEHEPHHEFIRGNGPHSRHDAVPHRGVSPLPRERDPLVFQGKKRSLVSVESSSNGSRNDSPLQRTPHPAQAAPPTYGPLLDKRSMRIQVRTATLNCHTVA